MSKRDEIMRRGEFIYSAYARQSGFTYCNRKFADSSSETVPAYILVEERFTTGHDDLARFVELIDENNNIIRSWKFDYPMENQFRDPDYYDDDCLVCYLMERFNLPPIGYRAPK